MSWDQQQLSKQEAAVLLARTLKETGKSIHVKPGNKRQVAPTRKNPVLQCLRMDKDFRYYFQHPWSRLVVAYLVIFFNFLIFAEDPVSHSQTEANVIVVGQLLRLKMFREDHGSWMTMFFSTILFLFIFSHIYNLFLIMAGNMRLLSSKEKDNLGNELVVCPVFAIYEGDDSIGNS
ncbi:hypothetical protein TURU_025024 [Turdus rufiventris]|nr:hypothetical protein TURU_025024 [Turdus rufiventris]